MVLYCVYIPLQIEKPVIDIEKDIEKLKAKLKQPKPIKEESSDV